MSFHTKFRAFQLDSPGSLFSYFKNNHYTLIEARLPKTGQAGLDIVKADLAFHNKETIDLLHITSWDADHCTTNDLREILNHLRPSVIEVPSYDPVTEDGRTCQRWINVINTLFESYAPTIRIVNREYLDSLTVAPPRGENSIAYRSKFDCDNKNDMSQIRLFRSKGFNVLSVGDCECSTIADSISGCSMLQTETDVLILAHHGAANGFTSGKLLDILKPKIAICSSNYGNHYDHPRQEVCGLLSSRGIPLMTTKRGDVVIYQMEGADTAVAVNMASNNEIAETAIGIRPKRYEVSAFAG